MERVKLGEEVVERVTRRGGEGVRVGVGPGVPVPPPAKGSES